MIEHIPWLADVFERPVRINQGHALVPHEAGAGTHVRPDAIARFKVG